MSRFAHINTIRTEKRAPWDHIIYEDDEIFVVPTKGSLLPFWLLLVPKIQVLNFNQFRIKKDINPIDLVSRVANFLENQNKNWVWFEHGATNLGSKIGCGVDQAHIHLLIRPPFGIDEFMSVNTLYTSHEWKQTKSHEAYSKLKADKEYYLCGGTDQVFYNQNERPHSQFFRKNIAKMIGNSDQWDYRKFDGVENVNFTLKEFVFSMPIAS